MSARLRILLQNLQEDVDHVRIELRAGESPQLGDRLFTDMALR